MLDFDDVLARGASKPSSDQDEEGDPDRPVFSLITGRYRHAKRYGGELLYPVLFVPLFFSSRNTTTYRKRSVACATSIVLGPCPPRSRSHNRNTQGYRWWCALFSLCDLPDALAESSSRKGEFLQSRTFRGLETRTGLDPPSVLQQGRSGIARGYDDDYRA
jgi:diphthamide biosynthesis protein 2